MKKAPKTIKLSCCHICALRIKFFHLVITGNDYIQIVNQFRFRFLRYFSQIIHENFLFAMTQDSNEYSFFSAEFFLHIASDLIFVSFCHFQYGNWNWKKKPKRIINIFSVNIKFYMFWVAMLTFLFAAAEVGGKENAEKIEFQRWCQQNTNQRKNSQKTKNFSIIFFIWM